MTSDALTDDVEWALSQVNRGEDVDRRAIELLLGADTERVEPQLLSLVSDSRSSYDIAGLASRILVERDQERDPSYVWDYFPGRRGLQEGTLARLADRLSAYPPPGAHYFGFSRLRRMDPIRMYSVILNHPSRTVRKGAVLALADSGDLAALEPLITALRDRNYEVRKMAADGFRRLRHAGAAGEVEQFREALACCLQDRRKVVRIAAARALGSMGDLEPLQQLPRRDRAEVERIKRGDIPPLGKTWPGDTAT